MQRVSGSNFPTCSKNDSWNASHRELFYDTKFIIENQSTLSYVHLLSHTKNILYSKTSLLRNSQRFRGEKSLVTFEKDESLLIIFIFWLRQSFLLKVTVSLFEYMILEILSKNSFILDLLSVNNPSFAPLIFIC